MKNNPIICALDTKSVSTAINLGRKIRPYVGGMKLGLEFFTVNGSQGIKQLAGLDIPVFLDLKFHDIPNTVANAVSAAVELNVRILTVHTIGGSKMMMAAAEAAKNTAAKLGKPVPMIVGVTVLTSLQDSDLNEMGINSSVGEQVAIMAEKAKSSGLDGVVCSAHEAAIVKEICGQDFKTVVPGIRLDNAEKNDQKRVMNPKQALANGADMLVIGRPITQSDDPALATKAIIDNIF